MGKLVEIALLIIAMVALYFFYKECAKADLMPKNDVYVNMETGERYECLTRGLYETVYLQNIKTKEFLTMDLCEFLRDYTIEMERNEKV